MEKNVAVIEINAQMKQPQSLRLLDLITALIEEEITQIIYHDEPDDTGEYMELDSVLIQANLSNEDIIALEEVLYSRSYYATRNYNPNDVVIHTTTSTPYKKLPGYYCRESAIHYLLFPKAVIEIEAESKKEPSKVCCEIEELLTKDEILSISQFKTYHWQILTDCATLILVSMNGKDLAALEKLLPRGCFIHTKETTPHQRIQKDSFYNICHCRANAIHKLLS